MRGLCGGGEGVGGGMRVESSNRKGIEGRRPCRRRARVDLNQGPKTRRGAAAIAIRARVRGLSPAVHSRGFAPFAGQIGFLRSCLSRTSARANDLRSFRSDEDWNDLVTITGYPQGPRKRRREPRGTDDMSLWSVVLTFKIFAPLKESRRARHHGRKPGRGMNEEPRKAGTGQENKEKPREVPARASIFYGVPVLFPAFLDSLFNPSDDSI